jgi:hypothetical protein
MNQIQRSTVESGSSTLPCRHLVLSVDGLGCMSQSKVVAQYKSHFQDRFSGALPQLLQELPHRSGRPPSLRWDPALPGSFFRPSMNPIRSSAGISC